MKSVDLSYIENKTLGVYWNPSKDKLYYSVSPNANIPSRSTSPYNINFKIKIATVMSTEIKLGRIDPTFIHFLV